MICSPRRISGSFPPNPGLKPNFMKKTVTILGATGQLGRQVVSQAIATGYKVKVLVRNEEKFKKLDYDGVEIIVGDVSKPDCVKTAIRGADVVISCLGNIKDVFIMESSYCAVLEAAKLMEDPPRCILMTTVGCGGSSGIIKFMLILIGSVTLKSLKNSKINFEDYERADRRVRKETDVPWVLVRPFALTEGDLTGKYAVKENNKGTFMKSISRADVANFYVECIDNQKWDGKAILLGGA